MTGGQLPRGKGASGLTGRHDKVTAVSVLAVVVVTALLYWQVVETRTGIARTVGFEVSIDNSRFLVRSVTPSLPADLAGLRAGDQVLKVAGQTVPTFEAYDAAVSSTPVRAPLLFELRRGGTDIALEVWPGGRFPWFDVLTNILVALTFLAVGIVALRQRENDLRAWLLFGFTAAVGVEFATAEPEGTILGATYSAVSVVLFSFVPGVQAGLEVHLATLIPDRPDWIRRARWAVPLIYVAALGWGLWVTWFTVLEMVGHPSNTVDAFTEQIRFSDIGLPLWGTVVAGILLHRGLTCTDVRGRSQAMVVLIGLAPWVTVVYLLTAYTIVGADAQAWIYAAQPFLLLAYPIAIVVAMFRYHLFDIQLVARRGLVFTAIAASLLVLFYGALGIGWTVLARVFEGDFSPWLLAAVTLLLGLMYAPLRSAMQAAVDRRFFPERVAQRQQLIRLADELPAQGALPRMGQYLSQRLCEVFGATSATVFLTDPNSDLLLMLASQPRPPADSGATLLLDTSDPGVTAIAQSRRPWSSDEIATVGGALMQRVPSLNAVLAAPILHGERLTALVLLGEKHDSQHYQAEELELLDLLSHHIATVFENVRLFESATIEGLTGLYRREAILERLDVEIHRAVRYSRPLSIGMIDLDNFKRINDSYGHLAGDGILQRVGQTLATGLRSADSVGRYGGEEFLLVLPETCLQDGIVVADKARQGIAGISYLNDDGSHVTVTASIGVASLNEITITGEEVSTNLLAAADRRLLEAKHRGRNRIEPSRPISA